MTCRRICFYTLVVLALSSASTLGQENAAKSLLSTVKIGQVVSLREAAGRYTITIDDRLPTGPKITEIGTDYLVIEEVNELIETVIPVYSIKAIVKVKPPKK